MKRIILSSSQSTANHYIQYIPELASVLSKIADAQTDEEAVRILNEDYYRYDNVSTKPQAMKAIWHTLQTAMKNYLESSEINANLQSVITKVLNACEKATGHASYPMTGIANAYVIDDDADFDDFEIVCSAVQKAFGIRDRDGAMLGGSWSGHSYVLDKVPFKISYAFNKIVVGFDE